MVESNTNVDISARNVDLMANKLQLFQYHDRYLIIQIRHLIDSTVFIHANIQAQILRFSCSLFSIFEKKIHIFLQHVITF
jgi:hypothetical protein